MSEQTTARVVELPEPALESRTSLERALERRRSVRDFPPDPLSLAEVSQLLWAAQGTTSDEGHRTAPSAGALYPLELYLAADRVAGLAPGVYHYHPGEHVLIEHHPGGVLVDLASAALDQECVQRAAVALVLAAVYERTTGEYGKRGKRYVHMEVGHAAQNVHLQAVALGLGTVVVGAFDEARVRRVLELPAREEPLAVMPLGRRR